MDEIFGEKVQNPLGIGGAFPESYGDIYGQESASGGGGLIGFLSNIIKSITIIGGIFVLLNLILAGFIYISAGQDPKQAAAAWAKIYMSLIGLIVMVAAYALTALAGWILFGDATAILVPSIYGPGIE